MSAFRHLQHNKYGLIRHEVRHPRAGDRASDVFPPDTLIAAFVRAAGSVRLPQVGATLACEPLGLCPAPRGDLGMLADSISTGALQVIIAAGLIPALMGGSVFCIDLSRPHHRQATDSAIDMRPRSAAANWFAAIMRVRREIPMVRRFTK